ncbi:ROK family transcriptional regulator [Ornatilinea apprima]|uniref:ROK family transcriptional regulator n=1 Tax=Ornatilinea apprima TaxID=1134406 RepID=UPI0009EAA7C3|nr:ROK family transcriptional regulator [Ornatilinea apprima]
MLLNNTLKPAPLQGMDGFPQNQEARSLLAISRDEEIFIQLIRRFDGSSKEELVDYTGYSRSKVNRVIQSLLDKRIIVETGKSKNTGGRRAVIFSLNGQLGLVAGVYVGATSIDLVLTDLSGRWLARSSEVAFVKDGPYKTLDRISEIIGQMVSSNGYTNEDVIGMGIGVPGPVDFSLGSLISPTIMPGWDKFPVVPYIHQAFPKAYVVVDNDVNMMAVGELIKGVGKGVKNLIFAKIGTGIGAGIICEGKIYRGTYGCAGDIAHICVDKNGPICVCGNTGCLEALAGGPAIANQGVKAIQEGRQTVLSEYYKRNNGSLTSIDIGNAAREGDAVAIEIIRNSGRIIGEVIAGLVNFFNPGMIIIGGGVSKLGNLFLSSIRQSILKRSLPLATRDLSILFSDLGDDAGVIGAVSMAMDMMFAAYADAPLV